MRLVARPLRRRLLAEAVAAVNGPIAAWSERHLRVLAALRTDGVVHLARAAAVAATAAVAAAAAAVVAGAAGLPPVRPALGLGGVAPFPIVLPAVPATRARTAT